jgi:hypothetical protein
LGTAGVALQNQRLLDTLIRVELSLSLKPYRLNRQDVVVLPLLIVHSLVMELAGRRRFFIGIVGVWTSIGSAEIVRSLEGGGDPCVQMLRPSVRSIGAFL